MDGDRFRQRQAGQVLRDFGDCADRASSLALILARNQSNEHCARRLRLGNVPQIADSIGTAAGQDVCPVKFFAQRTRGKLRLTQGHHFARTASAAGSPYSARIASTSCT
jgi:hypothetical protein